MFCAAVSAEPATQPAATGQGLEAYQQARFVAANGSSLNYRILSPAPISADQKYPLVIVLHGSGERGTDNAKQLVWGGREFIEHTKRHPAFVVFPQCPPNTWWDRADPKAVSPADGPAPDAPPVPMPTLVEMVKALASQLPVDPERVYVMGLSMGGFGTFELVNQLPGTFAVAAPMCGGGDVDEAGRYRSTRFWVFHGSADTAVPVEFSRQMVEAMRQAGVWVRYTEYLNGNHNAWTPTFNDRDFIEWLFAQKRTTP